MKFKLAPYAAAFALAAIATGPSAANEDADRAIRERKMKNYAADILAKYPAQKPYFSTTRRR